MRIAFLALLLAGCGGNINSTPAPQGWEIGPVIEGKNSSAGLSSTTGSFTISPTQQPHYVTRPGSSIPTRLRFTVTGPLLGVGCTSNSMVSLYFQAKGDDWATDGKRWWSGAAFIDHAGDYEIVAGKWSSVMTMTQDNAPQAFADASSHIARVGFTFGNCTGLGHGAVADGSVVFAITDFGVQ